MTAIWWIRRDLRLKYNPALQAALQTGRPVLPIFVIDPRLLENPAPARQGFLFAGLRALDADLIARGSRLIIRQGDPVEELHKVAQEAGAAEIFAAEDFSPYAKSRQRRAARELPLHLIGGITIHPPAMVRKQDGKPYTVFTPFSNAWKARPLPALANAEPDRPFLPAPAVASLALPEGQPPADFPAGEAEAQRRLARFLEGPIFDYADLRNRMDQDGTSALSPYLRFGMLSPLQAACSAEMALQSSRSAAERSGPQAWVNELIWREFYVSILDAFPEVLQTAFNPALRSISWRDDPEGLRAWQAGLTGYPIVDAAMRQLISTGWMHNRGRMITASFLVKNMLINWQAGESWFMRQLADGDPAANNGGWQWTAGVGTDAAPYFRIFNPLLQGQKFDPDGRYIRRWLPELAEVPPEYIHTPWKMPTTVQKNHRCQVGQDYPLPILDLGATRERALAAFRSAKNNSA